MAATQLDAGNELTVCLSGCLSLWVLGFFNVLCDCSAGGHFMKWSHVLVAAPWGASVVRWRSLRAPE